MILKREPTPRIFLRRVAFAASVTEHEAFASNASGVARSYRMTAAPASPCYFSSPSAMSYQAIRQVTRQIFLIDI